MKKSRTAFTLVELLTVLAIVGILMGLLIPAIGIVLTKAKEAQSRTDIMLTLTAIKAYYTDNSKFPNVGSPDSNGDLFVSGTANEKLYNILGAKKGNAEAAEQNPKMTTYFEASKKASAPKNGFFGSNATSHGVFYDPFGNAYEFLIDSNYDHEVQIPWQTHQNGENYATTVLGFTAGKNQTVDSPKKDDIVSW